MPQTLAMPALPAPKPISSDLADTLRARVALALMSGGIDTSPVQHWTQGAARVMQALVGGSMLRGLAESQAAKNAEFVNMLLRHPALGGAPDQSTTAPSVPAPSGPAPKTSSIPDDLRQTVTTAAARHGIDPNYALTAAKLESNFNPQARSPLSSATGLFQFVNPTWQRYGQGDVLDPNANADAAMRMARDNLGLFRQRFGRDPSNAELYLMHQQGPAGAAALLSNPQANAIDALTPAYRGNRALAQQAVINNGGRPTDTAAEFAGRIMQRAAAAERQLAQAMVPAAQTATPAASQAATASAPNALSSAQVPPQAQASGVLPRQTSPLTPEIANYIRQLLVSGNDRLIAYGLQLLIEGTKPVEYQIKEVGGRLFRVNPRSNEVSELPIGAKPQIVNIELPSGEKVTAQWDPTRGTFVLPQIAGQSAAPAAAASPAPQTPVPPTGTQPATQPQQQTIPPPPPGVNQQVYYRTLGEELAKKALTAPERKAQTEQAAKIVVEDIDRAIKLADDAFLPVTGMAGSYLSYIPGTAARDVSALIDTIKANVGFDKLQKMREASPTGGALGNVSDHENRMLQAVLGSLSQAQSPEQFRDNLLRLKNIFLDIVHGPGQGPPRERLSFAPSAPSGSAQPSANDPLGIR